VNIDEFKALLKRHAISMEEEEILRLYEIETRLAEILFEAWMRHRNK